MLEQSNSSPPVQSKRPSILKIFTLAGCGVALLSCVGFVCITVGLLAYFAGNPKDIVVSHEIPAQVAEGENFDLTLKITNTRIADIYVGDIDLQSMFSPTILEGVLVLGTEPEMERDYSIQGIKTFRFNDTLEPNETQIVKFHLKAFKPGNFGGQVAVYSGLLSYEVYPSITVTK
jgi:hypothetical protein